MRIIDSERGVPTTNLKRSLKFYTEALFFQQLSASRDRCTVALGADQIVFRKGHREEVRSLRDLDFSLSFRVDGIHGYYERIRATGRVEFEQELELMQPGVWQFSFVDCNGYRMIFSDP